MSVRPRPNPIPCEHIEPTRAGQIFTPSKFQVTVTVSEFTSNSEQGCQPAACWQLLPPHGECEFVRACWDANAEIFISRLLKSRLVIPWKYFKLDLHVFTLLGHWWQCCYNCIFLVLRGKEKFRGQYVNEMLFNDTRSQKASDYNHLSKHTFISFPQFSRLQLHLTFNLITPNPFKCEQS